jgi:26S proteasome regulatory subunit N5
LKLLDLIHHPIMSAEPPKQLKDYTEEVKRELPKLIEQGKSSPNNLNNTLEELLTLEKRTRLAADTKNSIEICIAILELTVDTNNWQLLNDYISILSKRRAQLQKVQETIITHTVNKLVSKAPNKEERRKLIETLRTVSDGKMFVELERARLSKELADMEESAGNVSKAAEILQEIQVETIGTMELREKLQFLLNQIRLCLAKKDYVRAEIIAKKVDTKNFAATVQPDVSDLKLKFYQLMITYYTHFSNYFEIAKAYREIRNTKSVEQDNNQYKQILQKLITFGILSEFDSEVSDLLNRIKLDKKLNGLPAYKQLLEQFTGEELMNWPLKYEKEIKADSTFSQNSEGDEVNPNAATTANNNNEKMSDDHAASGSTNSSSSSAAKGSHILFHNKETRWADFHKRIVQHNLRIISTYYTAIHSKRLSELLSLSEADAEQYLSELVSSKQLWARIDRPTGQILFKQQQTPQEQLNDWQAYTHTHS